MIWIASIAALLVLSGAGAAVVFSHRRARAIERLELHGVVGAADDGPEERASPIIVRRRWLAFVAAIGACVLLATAFAWPFWLAAAAAFVIGALAWILEEFLAARLELMIDEQIADTIDMIVSALRSGTSLVDAIAIAAEESRRPLRIALDEVVRRLRLGDDPDVVFHDLGVRVDTEAAQVLAFCLTVHWRVGGSLAPALASVSTSARHRIEFTRRVRSQATEGRASLIGMLGITYVLTLLLWKAYPERFEGFLASQIGIALAAAAIFLQGIGLVWTTAMTRIKA